MHTVHLCGGLKLVRAEHGYLTHPAGIPVWEQRDYQRVFALIRREKAATVAKILTFVPYWQSL